MIDDSSVRGWPSTGKCVTTLLLIAMLLLGMGLRLWGLDSKGLWQDEIFTAAIASPENTVLEVMSIPLYNTALPAPPLYFLITHLFLIPGDTDFVLRFPALAFGVLGLAATYTVGAYLFGRAEGLMGTILLAMAPFHVRYSQDARFYTLVVLLSLLSVYFLCRGLSSGKRSWFAAFVLCSVLNLYTHLFAFLVLAAQVVFVVGLWVAGEIGRSTGGRSGTKERAHAALTVDAYAALTVGLCLIIMAVAYAPMVPHLWRGLAGAKGVSAGGAALDLSFVVSALDSWGLGSGWRMLALAVPFAIGVVASARTHRRQLWLVCCWILVPFVTLIVLPAGHGFRPRYVLFMLPLYLLVSARGLTAAGNTIGGWLPVRRQRARTIVIVGLVGAMTLASIPALQAYYREDRADWRSVASLVVSGISAGDVIVSPGPFPQVVMPRYQESLGQAMFLIGGTEVFLTQQEGEGGGVWFVGPAREKMRAIDEELVNTGVAREKVVFEVDDNSVARGRELKIAPVMYDDLWVLYVRQGS